MRLLLNRQIGCTSFEDIRTVDGHVYNSYREACAALGLLANDRQFIDLISEIVVVGSGSSIRKVFTSLLLTSCMSDPLNVWNQTWHILSEGILYERRRTLNSPG